jgi:hypothetical protein
MRPHWTLDVEESRSCRFDNSINTTNRYGRHVVSAVHIGTSFSRIFRFQLFHLTLVKVAPFHILLMVPLCLVSLGPKWITSNSLLQRRSFHVFRIFFSVFNHGIVCQLFEDIVFRVCFA